MEKSNTSTVVYPIAAMILLLADGIILKVVFQSMESILIHSWVHLSVYFRGEFL